MIITVTITIIVYVDDVVVVITISGACDVPTVRNYRSVGLVRLLESSNDTLD